jgi:ubiquinone/menaquinone biosynthesis C-methylase UbiE
MTGRSRDHSGEYIHGTDPEEQARLALMNTLINRPSLAELALKGGEKILEVASGLGHMARAMARAAGPSGTVIGIEQSAEQIAGAHCLAAAAGEEGLVETRQGDALDPPLSEAEWGSFDLVHARFLLEHVTDPEGITSMMVRAARPGGRIVVEDDNHEMLRLWPEPDGFHRLIQAYMDMFRHLGCDPLVGGRMVSLLHQTGAIPVRTALIPYTACKGSPLFDGIVRNLVEVVGGTRKAVVENGLLDAATFDAGVASLQAWAGLPDATVWYYICWAEGRRPHGGGG